MASHIASAEPMQQYLQEARKYDYLTPDQERDLAIRWRDRQDRAALDRLVGSHLRLVFKMARGYSGYGLPLSDLIAEGNVGVMQAAQKFDPDKGFRFATYASWWIRASIQEYVLHNWSLVKIGTTGAQKKLFFSLRRLKARMQDLENGDLTPEAVESIATELNVPQAEVVEMNRRLGMDRSLNATLAEEGDSEWQDLLADDRPDQEASLAEAEERQRRQQFLKLGLGVLDDRERQILVARRLREEPLTLEELSQRFHVSRERVRQLEVRAFEKVQRAVVASAKEQKIAAADKGRELARA
ncbi:RNA polymerase sigma factor RpoH [Azospirillum rugosum]|uniref:RNA polymerase sigma factor RpoH n=1 Tax=Azospirillum rugosum TaxID=416170 RepID=A0ABS4SSH7_9PROT|nr:RNA polymerase sigma factor RpoH [Azospirillum rugosum]MBP2295518.1 RNA polymerase sigma-32 factor [Azospirillum rugosum]MDQ0528397.1 RNA polymerase sigma-32 factor [Azospirillum rugosum]